jgi:hypothetical protein
MKEPPSFSDLSTDSQEESMADPIERTPEPEGKGETIKLSQKTADALDRFRVFYRNNRGQEITRDEAIQFATTMALAYGQTVTGTADGRRTQVRG